MSPALKKLLFGTAGVPLSTSDSSTFQAIDQVAQLGLDCLEVEFVQGIKMGLETASKIRRQALSKKIELSVHAPYFINLNSDDRGKRLQSQERLASSARLAATLGARCVVFHAGYYGKDAPEAVFAEVKRELAQVVSLIRSEKLPVTMRIETMGKKAQFGTFEEVLFLCREIEGLEPCLDFSHIHAREGKINSYPEFSRVLEKVGKKLGRSSLKDVHIHISGSHYNATGELKHLDLEESDFCFDDWIQALKDYEVEGMVICESPNLETDALMLKNLYRAQQAKS